MSASSVSAEGASSPPGAFRTPGASSQAEVRDRGSRFLAVVLPAATAAQAQEQLEALRRRYPDATHHCWAWRLAAGSAERSSDDGEPAGTAGVPMLQVLRGAELWNLLAVVVRWYGGTKLGKGGLARAYAAAVREALAALPVIERVPTVEVVIRLPYERLGAVKRLLHPPRLELVSETYGAQVELVLAIWLAEKESLKQSLADLGLSIESSEIRPA